MNSQDVALVEKVPQADERRGSPKLELMQVLAKSLFRETEAKLMGLEISLYAEWAKMVAASLAYPRANL